VREISQVTDLSDDVITMQWEGGFILVVVKVSTRLSNFVWYRFGIHLYFDIYTPVETISKQNRRHT